MSKVIVDQIQKNGGTTFTLPSTDGGANAPLTTNASGTLAFSPLKLPAADGTANKPITTDGSGQLQFSPNALPAAIGTAGQVMKVNSGATALEYGSIAVSSIKKTLNFKTNPAQSSLVTYASISSDIAFANVAGVRLSVFELASSSATHMRIYGLNASGTRISSGYFGCRYDTPQSNGSVHNSNGGYIRFPGYSTNFAQTGYNYGQGFTGTIMFNPWREGSGNELNKAFQCKYDMTWQHSSETEPYIEHGGWGQYETQTDGGEWAGGFEIYAEAGNFNHGRVVVEVIMEG